MSKLAKVKSQIKNPLRQATLVFLIKDNQILLAMKKRGFGEGKWNGVGGKPDAGESIESAAVRETQEEIGVTPQELKQVAVLNFYFEKSPPGKDWNQQVLVYTTTKWEGEPTETEEMSPKWFDQDKIPYTQMWWDDIHWLPRVLKGENLIGDFLFGQDQSLLEFKLISVGQKQS